MTRPRWTRALPRLALDLAAVGLLLLAFAYWWLGNLAHELFGTAFFVILVRHIVNNRHWWSALRRGSYDLRRGLSVFLALALALAMAVLLLTSIAISESVFGFLPLPDIFTLREIHWFAAYWALAIVGLHLGVNWPRLAALLRNVAGARPATRWWDAAMAAVSLGFVVQGYLSGAVMGLWPRLMFSYSLVMWDFNASVLPFFGHWLAILGLFAVIGHQVSRLAELAATRSRAVIYRR